MENDKQPLFQLLEIKFLLIITAVVAVFLYFLQYFGQSKTENLLFVIPVVLLWLPHIFGKKLENWGWCGYFIGGIIFLVALIFMLFTILNFAHNIAVRSESKQVSESKVPENRKMNQSGLAIFSILSFPLIVIISIVVPAVLGIISE